MRKRMAQGLTIVFLWVASLGAAQGPTGPAVKLAQSFNSEQNVVILAKKELPKPYQIGTASWYGDYFVGKPTASGEPYNMYGLTAAHPTLPLGSYVRVTNLRNNRSIVLRINDRGPVVPGRIIDVSYSAARVLQFKGRGLQRVRLDVVTPETVAMLEPLAK